MREMKDSGIQWLGEYPNDWNLIKIKYCLKERVEKNNPVRTTDILSLTAKQGVIPYDQKEGGGNKPKEDVSAYRLAYPGDIVMNSMNVLSGSVGLSNYFGCVSPVYYMLRPIDKSEDVRFYNYIFQSTVFQRSLYGLGNGILIKESGNGKLNTIRMRIPIDKFGGLFIPVAPIQEQKRIADFLDTKCAEIDALTADIQTQIDTLEQYKRSVITEAVTKGLNPDVAMKDSGIECIDKIPKDWSIKRVKYISTSLSKGNGITREDVKENGDIQCVRYGEIYSKYESSFKESVSYTNLESISSPKFIFNGDILFAGTGELIEEIGKNIVYLGSAPCLAGGDIVVMRHSQNPVFLNYTLNSCYAQVQKSKGKAKLKVVHISAFDIGNIRVALPSIQEQEEIANFLETKCAEINGIITEKKEQLEVLNEYKKSLIYEYVTGKKEVPANA